MLGTPHTPALLLVGLNARAAVFPLALLGSPTDCFVHVEGILTALPAPIGAALEPRSPHLGGAAGALIGLPNDAGLLGAVFTLQGLELGARITASEAVRCTLAPSPPQLGMATIDRRDPAATDGSITAGRGPVLRFEYR